MLKKLFIVLIFVTTCSELFAFGGAENDGTSGPGEEQAEKGSYENDWYKVVVKYVKSGKKLEKKGKIKKAKKKYEKALKYSLEAYKTDKQNPDILNYLGFAYRKLGKLEEAEIYYRLGLSMDPKHSGINEYLGELYLSTNRIEEAKERLSVLKNCNCEEYEELKVLIESSGN